MILYTINDKIKIKIIRCLHYVITFFFFFFFFFLSIFDFFFFFFFFLSKVDIPNFSPKPNKTKPKKSVFSFKKIKQTNKQIKKKNGLQRTLRSTLGDDDVKH